MDQNEELLSSFFTNVAQLCFDKAREEVVMYSYLFLIKSKM